MYPVIVVLPVQRQLLEAAALLDRSHDVRANNCKPDVLETTSEKRRERGYMISLKRLNGWSLPKPKRVDTL